MTFSNNSDQKERKQVIKNTYLAHTHSDEGGRFSKVAPNNVIGATAVSYPRIASGPWSDQPSPGQEPPYGEDISTPPIVGEQWEIEKSLDQNFALQRSLRDGAPPSVGLSSVPTASELAPAAEAKRIEEPVRHSPAAEMGDGVRNQRDGVGAPSSIKSKPIIRRLR
jgi:hypothetical protein